MHTNVSVKKHISAIEEHIRSLDDIDLFEGQIEFKDRMKNDMEGLEANLDELGEELDKLKSENGKLKEQMAFLEKKVDDMNLRLCRVGQYISGAME